MIKDRGNKKWQGMFLVEHKKRLQELKKSFDDVEKPILDEQQLEYLNKKIREVIETGEKVEITYYKDKRIKKLHGLINDFSQKTILIRVKSSSKTLQINNILDIN